MKRIELQSLRLRSFKGARTFDLELGGGSASVRGRNGSGKTTLADAYSYLLFEKDSSGRKDFDIKTLVDGTALSGVDHEVEGVFTVDGEELTLKRTYRELWPKKRGSPTATFTGHETAHHIDGVPVTKGEYTQRVSEIADEATWRLLSDPSAFQALHWKDRRKVLLEVCGDVSDADVIAADPELADLPEILGKRTLDEHRKVVAARRAELNKEINELPVRISEVQLGLPEAPGQSRKLVEAGLAGARRDRQAAAERLAQAKAGAGDAAAERRALREVEDALTALDRQAARAADEAVSAARAKALAAQRALDDGDQRLARFEQQTVELEGDVARLDDRLADLRQQWATVSARKIEAHVDGTCPACQQALPSDQVEEAHRKGVEELNAAKAKELARIKGEGDALGARKKTAAAELAVNTSEAEALRAGRPGLQAALERAEAAVTQAARTPTKEATATPAYAKLAAERDDLTARIAQLEAGDETALEALAAEAEELEQLVSAFEGDLAALQARATGEARITELKEQERTLAREFEELERQLWLMDAFTRAKVALLESRVAERFRLVSFRLFRTQVNGGLEECCDATVNGVPYESVNHAGRIAAGLDIIRTLQEHHRLSAPIWVDQAESIHDIPVTGAQQIALVVSPTDKQLRVELREATEVAA